METLGRAWWMLDGWRAFVRTMRTTDDPQAAMVAADWLDDEGQIEPWRDAASARAELIRWQCDGGDAALPEDFTVFRLANLPGIDPGPRGWLFYGKAAAANGNRQTASPDGYAGDAFRSTPAPADVTGWMYTAANIGGNVRLQDLLGRVTVGHLADARLLRFRSGQLVSAGFPAWRFNCHTAGPAVACEPLRSIECQYTYPVPWSHGMEWNYCGPEQPNRGTLGKDFVHDVHERLAPPGLGPPPGGSGSEAMAWSDRRRDLQIAYGRLLHGRGGRTILHPAAYIDTPGLVPAPLWHAFGPRQRWETGAAAVIALDRAARTCAVRWANKLTGEGERYLEPDAWPDADRVAARAGWEGRLWRAAVGPSTANLLGILPEDLPVTPHIAGRRRR